MWSTGPVGKVQRAILQDGTVVAVADTMEQASRIVRLLNNDVRPTASSALWDAVYILADRWKGHALADELMGVLSRHASSLPWEQGQTEGMR